MKLPDIATDVFGRLVAQQFQLSFISVKNCTVATHEVQRQGSIFEEVFKIVLATSGCLNLSRLDGDGAPTFASRLLYLRHLAHRPCLAWYPHLKKALR